MRGRPPACAIAPPPLNDATTTPATLPRLELGLRFGLGLALALLGLLVYLGGLGGQFVYDDHILIEGNRYCASLGAAVHAFFEPLWASDPQGEIPNAFWRPLTVVVLAITRDLAGLEPRAFHVVSLLLHLAATWAAWRLATRLLRCGTLGWLVAALFAVHPAHVESVAWASAVNDPLFALFAMLSLERYLAWRERGLRGVPWAAGVLLLLGLLAKEQALVVPLVALVLDLVFRHLHARGPDHHPHHPAAPRAGAALRPWRRPGAAGPASAQEQFARAYGPWVIAVALYVVGRMVTYDSVLAGFDEVSAQFALPLAREMLLRVEIFGAFLEGLFVPLEYTLFRQVRPELPEGSTAMTRAWIALALWAAATTLAAWQGRRLALAALLAIPTCFVLLLVNLEAAGAYPISDRFLYLPVVFAGVVVVGLLSKLLPRPATFGVGLALTAAAAWVSTERVELFVDDETLLRAAVEAEPDNLRTRVAIGNELLQLYHQTLDKEYLDEALFHYLTSLMLGFDYGPHQPKKGPDDPWIERARELDHLLNGVPATDLGRDNTIFVSPNDRIAANIGYGAATLALGNLPPEYDLDWPKTVYEFILRRYPEMPEALDGLGQTLYRMGDYEGSEDAFNRALVSNKLHVPSWHNLGVLLAARGRYDEARRCFDEALRLRPGNRRDLIEAASCAINGQRYPQAEDYIERLEDAHPGELEVLYLQGMLSAVRGDLGGAIARFDALLAQDDLHAHAHLQRAKARAGLGQRGEATRAFRRAAELNPSSFEAHYNLASLLLANPEAGSEAVPYLARAYELSPPTTSRAELFRRLSGLLREQVTRDERALNRMIQYARLDQRRRDFVHALGWVEAARMPLTLRFEESPEAKLRSNLVFLLNLRGELFEGLATALEEQREAYLVQAHDSYSEGLRLAPGHFFLNNNMAMLLSAKLRRVEEAKVYAKVALDNLGQLGDTPAAQAVERALQTILATKPQMGPLLDPEDG